MALERQHRLYKLVDDLKTVCRHDLGICIPSRRFKACGLHLYSTCVDHHHRLDRKPLDETESTERCSPDMITSDTFYDIVCLHRALSTTEIVVPRQATEMRLL